VRASPSPPPVPLSRSSSSPSCTFTFSPSSCPIYPTITTNEPTSESDGRAMRTYEDGDWEDVGHWAETIVLVAREAGAEVLRGLLEAESVVERG
jgi:hypothetical protein